MYYSYITSLTITNIWLLLLIEENDYRQGLDYNILTIHLHSIFNTYLSVIILLVIYFFNTIKYIENNWIKIFNKISLASSLNLIISGIFWSWSQWGTIQLYDIKIIITIIMIVVFTTVNILLAISKNINSLLVFCNLYVLYHIPLLKYNVMWNSEIHQKNTFSLIDFFLVNYSSISFLIILAIVAILHNIIRILYLKKKIFIKHIT